MQDILQQQLKGTVLKETFHSPVLGVKKNYHIYLPPGYHQSTRRYPVLYLFRGHEDEWFNPYQDHSRGGVAVQHLADELIQAGDIGGMILVGPSLMSDNGQVYGLGVNFLDPDAASKHAGIGTGRFEDYFIEDVIGHIDRNYRTIPKGAARGADGFSLGGYTSVMLAMRHPKLFSSVGSYDGSHMFWKLRDPRYNKPHDFNDTLWVRNDKMFAPVFSAPGERNYDLDHLQSYSALDVLHNLSPAKRKQVQNIRFSIKTAAYDGHQGNRDRGVHLVTLFQLYDIFNDAGSLVLSSDAHHTWKFTDLYMRENIKHHAAALGAKSSKTTEIKGNHYLTHLEIIAADFAEAEKPNVLVKYHVYENCYVRINILNSSGGFIATLKSEVHECGRFEIAWHGQNERGHWMPSGMYFIELETPAGAIRKKFVFLR